MKVLAMVAGALCATATAGPGFTQSVATPPWQGWYIGGDAGGLSRHGQNTSLTTGLTGSSASNGEAIGVHGGYNWQSGPWVFGVETDWSHSFINGASHDLDMFSGRARAGWTFSSWMIYATAGVATENRYLTITRFGLGTAASFTDQQQHFGPIVGVGVETMLGKQFSLRGEVLYFDGGRRQYNFPASGVFPATSWSSTFNQIDYRVGASYHFN
jgi:outer membrane immunogenic protein